MTGQGERAYLSGVVPGCLLVTLYARSEHGAVPVLPLPGGGYSIPTTPLVTLSRPALAGSKYPTGWALLTALTGRTNHGLTVQRYFRFDPSAPLHPCPSVLDVINEVRDTLAVVPHVAVPKENPPLTVQAPPGTDELGIDLHKRGHEVRKLLFAGFGQRILRKGYDPEEVLQDVFRGILARNRGKCPFDKKKSSFGHYTFMVAECVLNNFARKETRRREVEQSGMHTVGDEGGDGGGIVDVAVALERRTVEGFDAREPGEAGTLARFLTRYPDDPESPLTDDERADLRLVIPLLLEDKSRAEIVKATGLPSARVGEAMLRLREALDSR